MDKLFDLMLMGFKYQLLCSTRLDQMLEVGGRAGVVGGWAGSCVAHCNPPPPPSSVGKGGGGGGSS